MEAASWLLCLSIAACCTSAHTTTTTAASGIDTTAPEELWQAVVAARNTYSGTPASPLDLRVTPAHAYRGPGQVRISVISNASAIPADKEFFTYNAPFQYRWTNKYLQSTLKPVRPDGTPTTFNINDVSFEVTVPAQGAGTLGLIFADPCFAGAAATCFWASKFQTFERMTELMNVVVPKVDYWQILGDNFYDRDGHLTQAWYDQLSLNVKSTLFATTAGNHDYWGFGSSIIGLDIDQFGNGLMQYYGMDTISSYQMSQNKTIPTGHFIDYSIDPDAKKTKHALPPLENFFTWFAIGNVGYILYSGGYEYQDTKPYFEEACAWLKEEKPAVAFIAGHWNDAGLGCSSHMDVPAVYEELRAFDGCRQLDAAHNLKYIMGHTHCNEITAHDKADGSALGFMVAGQGMEGCGNFGFPLVETLTGEHSRIEVIYYELQNLTKNSDRYEIVLDCFQEKGPLGCKELGTMWLNQTIGDTVW